MKYIKPGRDKNREELHGRETTKLETLTFKLKGPLGIGDCRFSFFPPQTPCPESQVASILDLLESMNPVQLNIQTHCILNGGSQDPRGPRSVVSQVKALWTEGRHWLREIRVPYRPSPAKRSLATYIGETLSNRSPSCCFQVHVTH